MDIAAAGGKDVFAAHDGTVVDADDRAIKVQAASGKGTFYGNLDKLSQVL
jgi:murein DD-endopeptidase MepM/ murein hydrolase activator NlpD